MARSRVPEARTSAGSSRAAASSFRTAETTSVVGISTFCALPAPAGAAAGSPEPHAVSVSAATVIRAKAAVCRVRGMAR
ncbi:hypothetical protein [Streptomyces sp. DpondAA-F4a]|uniref:hypothetical protein n=1 Tax=unclassified Streptomyces TaxID=2593676 RepID=UPI00210DB22F|nr:hypothetical protein [Streptomyces sp. DpondAA-F4a]